MSEIAIIFDEQGKPITPDNPFPTQLSGSTVSVGGTDFTLYNGNELHGLAADRPTAATAHAVIPWAFYVAVDTQVITQTDGTTWR